MSTDTYEILAVKYAELTARKRFESYSSGRGRTSAHRGAGDGRSGGWFSGVREQIGDWRSHGAHPAHGRGRRGSDPRSDM